MSAALMTRLLVEAEGETEETFVKELLSLHLYNFGYTQVAARQMGNARERFRRGGVRPWPEVRDEILSRLKGDEGIIIATMVDYYGMPQSGPGAWPGRAGAAALLSYPNAIEESLLADIAGAMGGSFNPRRFIPYVMMHEFEAMLFSDCAEFARGIGQPDLTQTFQEIRDQFDTPENIDDSPDTAPSKRIEALVFRYRKPVIGIQAATAIGLPAIRAECGHFRGWLERLESLAAPG